MLGEGPPCAPPPCWRVAANFSASDCVTQRRNGLRGAAIAASSARPRAARRALDVINLRREFPGRAGERCGRKGRLAPPRQQDCELLHVRLPIGPCGVAAVPKDRVAIAARRKRIGIRKVQPFTRLRRAIPCAAILVAGAALCGWLRRHGSRNAFRWARAPVSETSSGSHLGRQAPANGDAPSRRSARESAAGGPAAWVREPGGGSAASFRAQHRDETRAPAPTRRSATLAGGPALRPVSRGELPWPAAIETGES